MILSNKNAVIYGAGGSMGEAVATALAASGARVFLTGRSMESLKKVAAAITAAGGIAQADIVDAFDENAVQAHIDKTVREAGSVDVSFNAVGVAVKQGTALADLSLNDFVQPVTQTLTTRFITATAAARLMRKQKSGVILFLTATPAGVGYPFTGGFAAACSATENFSLNLASELGPHGIRVVAIRSGGSPDSRVFKEVIDRDPATMNKVLAQMKQDTMLKKLPPMADIANTVVFLASDLAASITGVTIDVTAGTTGALNYRNTL